jgi:hypothetical protein
MDYDETEDIYLAIGRFVVAFSGLIHAMDTQTAFHLAAGRPVATAQAALGSREAKAVLEGYLGLAYELDGGRWQDEDRTLVKVFRREVMDLISERNRIAHDAWFVGWDENTGEHTSWRLRAVTTRSGVRQDAVTLTADEIFALAEDADRLREAAWTTLLRPHAAMLRLVGGTQTAEQVVANWPRPVDIWRIGEEGRLRPKH